MHGLHQLAIVLNVGGRLARIWRVVGDINFDSDIKLGRDISLARSGNIVVGIITFGCNNDWDEIQP